MLEAAVIEQLKSYLERVTRPFTMVAYLDDSEGAAEMRELLTAIVPLSPLIRYQESTAPVPRRPMFELVRDDGTARLQFAAVPMGHEFPSLILALLHVGGHPPKLEPDVVQQIRELPGEYHFETFISLTCQNCPEVVQALNMMSVINPKIHHVMIDGAINQVEVDRRQIMAVPTTVLDGEVFVQGRVTVEDILQKLDKNAGARAAAKLADKAPYDVLVVGGGPAGAAAAIYAARKGIRTGLVADRFGGQVLDTMAIENFISVKATDGPHLAAALEEHVRQYEVDIMKPFRATRLVPATDAGSLHTIELENGASLKAKSVVLATGARWRQLNVPGEKAHLGKGVAYCPHCDGPLYKGKRVAVIGGGNSGVEAAIDLAGIVSHVTLIEYADKLLADAILQKKLRSLPNVTIIMSAQTTEVLGNGVVTGLRYTDRVTGASHDIALEGIFVQIGLLPNSEWLKDTVALSPRGEVEMDLRGKTSAPGVFAAGDVTVTPYKQIVIALGEGSKAAISAFDYLIRSSVGG